MTDIDHLLRRVSAKASQQVRAEAGTTPERLPPTATEDEVATAERTLGFELHPVLARLYREVANGGFGPEYHLLPLTGEGRTAVSVYLEERAASGSAGEARWPADVLPILDWGCGMYAAVDCSDPEGGVLLFEPNAVDDDWRRAWYVDSASLTAWLETWLSETGWYEEDSEGEDDPRPWDAAGKRLSERR